MSYINDVDRCFMIARTPVLSDGAKITLQTMYGAFIHKGTFPTVRRVAEQRGVSRVTVHKHVNEMVEAGVLSKETVGQRIVYTILWSEIAHSLGFKTLASVDIARVLSVASPRGANQQDMHVLVSDPTTPKELLTYFRMKYSEKLGKEYKVERPDSNRMRLLVKEYGAPFVKKMIDRFAKHRGKMLLGKFCVKTLYYKRSKIAERLET